jgi:intracellular sulfur oxidation DsrE/DsrF family protein
MPKFFRHLTVMALMSMSLVSASFAGDAKAPHVAKAHPVAIAHRVAIQVDQNDPAVMNLALNNATNVVEYYRAKGENVDVDIVTYGPGLHMLRVDTSPVQDRIKNLKDLAFPGKIQFSACNNTKEGMQKKEGQTVALLPQASIVPSGVVRLMQLQEQGWSYVRP